MLSIDRNGIAERLRSLLAGQDDEDLSRTAARLGVEDFFLRMAIEGRSPIQTVDVLAAVIQEYGVDPTWLVTGVYDAGTHRAALENGEVDRAVRDLMGTRAGRLAEPPHETGLFLQD